MVEVRNWLAIHNMEPLKGTFLSDHLISEETTVEMGSCALVFYSNSVCKIYVNLFHFYQLEIGIRIKSIE